MIDPSPLLCPAQPNDMLQANPLYDGTTISLAEFYGEFICSYIREQPGHYAPNIDVIRLRLGINKEEFKLGLDWCVERGIITLTNIPSKPIGCFRFDFSQQNKVTSEVNFERSVSPNDLAKITGLFGGIFVQKLTIFIMRFKKNVF